MRTQTDKKEFIDTKYYILCEDYITGCVGLRELKDMARERSNGVSLIGCSIHCFQNQRTKQTTRFAGFVR